MNSKRINVLQVLMNGHLVGRLSNSARGVLSFDYDQSWLDFERKRSISLSMPLASPALYPYLFFVFPNVFPDHPENEYLE
jgi:serine/threonine-protein kinase HipA